MLARSWAGIIEATLVVSWRVRGSGLDGTRVSSGMAVFALMHSRESQCSLAR